LSDVAIEGGAALNMLAGSHYEYLVTDLEMPGMSGKELVELIPNREDGICCGGGGGILQDSTSKNKRMITGKPKADQMVATGLPHLATACLSCHRQLGELSNHYKLGIKVDTVASLASESLIL